MVNFTMTPGKIGERPEVVGPKKEFLEQLTVDGFKKMVNDFYDIVVDSDIAFFFPQEEDELNHIKHRNATYFMQICGGEDTYTKGGGSFDQVKVHAPFSINSKARTEWLGCWKEVLEVIEKEGKVSEDAIQSYWNWLDKFSIHMINFQLDSATNEERAAKNLENVK